MDLKIRDDWRIQGPGKPVRERRNIFSVWIKELLASTTRAGSSPLTAVGFVHFKRFWHDFRMLLVMSGPSAFGRAAESEWVIVSKQAVWCRAGSIRSGG